MTIVVIHVNGIYRLKKIKDDSNFLKEIEHVVEHDDALVFFNDIESTVSEFESLSSLKQKIVEEKIEYDCYLYNNNAWFFGYIYANNIVLIEDELDLKNPIAYKYGWDISKSYKAKKYPTQLNILDSIEEIKAEEKLNINL